VECLSHAKGFDAVLAEVCIDMRNILAQKVKSMQVIMLH